MGAGTARGAASIAGGSSPPCRRCDIHTIPLFIYLAKSCCRIALQVQGLPPAAYSCLNIAIFCVALAAVLQNGIHFKILQPPPFYLQITAAYLLPINKRFCYLCLYPVIWLPLSHYARLDYPPRWALSLVLIFNRGALLVGCRLRKMFFLTTRPGSFCSLYHTPIFFAVGFCEYNRCNGLLPAACFYTPPCLFYPAASLQLI